MILDTGYANFIMTDKVIAITHYDSLPVKRLVKQAEQEGKLVNQTGGKAAKSVIATIDGYVVLSFIDPATLKKRLLKNAA